MTRKRILLLQDRYKQILLEGDKIIINNHKYTAKEIQDLLAEQYKKHNKPRPMTLEDMKRYDRISKLDKDIEKAIRNLYKANAAIAYTIFEQIYEAGFKGIADIITKNSKITEVPAIKNKVMEQVIMKETEGVGWTRRLTRYSQEATYKIQNEIRKGLSNGDVYETIAKKIKDEVGDEVSNSIRIVRTEGNRIWNESKVNAADEISKKVELEKTWLTARDERVRSFTKGDKADHTQMDGITIPYEEEFQLPSGATAFAPSMSGNAADDINCRCILEIRPRQQTL